MENGGKGINLIVATGSAAPGEKTDRGGGETHSLRDLVGFGAKVVEVDPERLRVDIDKCLAQMKQVFADLKHPAIDGWKVEHINVGLSVSAEGSVGVATAGVEASIEIGFVPEK
jgi:hypothetical protein